MLTVREKEIAILVAQGLGNMEIAEQLSISETTVRNHISNILGKLELRSCRQLSAFVWKRGWLDPTQGNST